MASKFGNFLNGLFNRPAEKDNNTPSSNAGGTEKAQQNTPAEPKKPSLHPAIQSYNSGIVSTKQNTGFKSEAEFRKQYNYAIQSGLDKEGAYKALASGTRWKDTALHDGAYLSSYETNHRSVTGDTGFDSEEQFNQQYNYALRDGLSEDEALTALATGRRWSELAVQETGIVSTKQNLGFKDENDFQTQYQRAVRSGLSKEEAYKALASGRRWVDVNSSDYNPALNPRGFGEQGSLMDRDKGPAGIEKFFDFYNDYEPKGAEAKARQQRRRARFLDKMSEAQYEDNFGGQFKASMYSSELSQRLGNAWFEYYMEPTKENYEYAIQLRDALEKFNEHNAEALDNENVKAGLISKDLAQYLPQLADQAEASVVPVVAGAAGGALVANLPGAITGAKAGMVVGSTTQSYAIMFGMAFNDLLEAGVDEQTAANLANDEAAISSIIEGGDTLISVAAGTGKLALGALKSIAGKGASAAVAKTTTTSLRKKLMKILGSYGTEILSEGGQEGLQEIVSIANQMRVADGNYNGGALELINYFGKALKRMSSEDWNQVGQATAGGARLALLTGGAEIGLSQVTNARNASNVNARVEEISKKYDEFVEGIGGKDVVKSLSPDDDRNPLNHVSSRQLEGYKNILDESLGSRSTKNSNVLVDLIHEKRNIEADKVKLENEKKQNANSQNLDKYADVDDDASVDPITFEVDKEQGRVNSINESRKAKYEAEERRKVLEEVTEAAAPAQDAGQAEHIANQKRERIASIKDPVKRVLEITDEKSAISSENVSDFIYKDGNSKEAKNANIQYLAEEFRKIDPTVEATEDSIRAFVSRYNESISQKKAPADAKKNTEGTPAKVSEGVPSEKGEQVNGESVSETAEPRGRSDEGSTEPARSETGEENQTDDAGRVGDKDSSGAQSGVGRDISGGSVLQDSPEKNDAVGDGNQPEGQRGSEERTEGAARGEESDSEASVGRGGVSRGESEERIEELTPEEEPSPAESEEQVPASQGPIEESTEEEKAKPALPKRKIERSNPVEVPEPKKAQYFDSVIGVRLAKFFGIYVKNSELGEKVDNFKALGKFANKVLKAAGIELKVANSYVSAIVNAKYMHNALETNVYPALSEAKVTNNQIAYIYKDIGAAELVGYAVDYTNDKDSDNILAYLDSALGINDKKETDILFTNISKSFAEVGKSSGVLDSNGFFMGSKDRRSAIKLSDNYGKTVAIESLKKDKSGNIQIGDVDSVIVKNRSVPENLRKNLVLIQRGKNNGLAIYQLKKNLGDEYKGYYLIDESSNTIIGDVIDDRDKAMVLVKGTGSYYLTPKIDLTTDSKKSLDDRKKEKDEKLSEDKGIEFKLQSDGVVALNLSKPLSDPDSRVISQHNALSEAIGIRPSEYSSSAVTTKFVQMKIDTMDEERVPLLIRNGFDNLGARREIGRKILADQFGGKRHAELTAREKAKFNEKLEEHKDRYHYVFVGQTANQGRRAIMNFLRQDAYEATRQNIFGGLVREEKKKDRHISIDSIIEKITPSKFMSYIGTLLTPSKRDVFFVDKNRIDEETGEFVEREVTLNDVIVAPDIFMLSQNELVKNMIVDDNLDYLLEDGKKVIGEDGKPVMTSPAVEFILSSGAKDKGGNLLTREDAIKLVDSARYELENGEKSSAIGNIVMFFQDIFRNLTDGMGFVNSSNKHGSFQLRSDSAGVKGLVLNMDWIGFMENMLGGPDNSKVYMYYGENGEPIGGFRWLEGRSFEILDKWGTWQSVRGKAGLLFDSVVKFAGQYKSSEDFYNRAGGMALRSVARENVYGSKLKVEGDTDKTGLAQFLRNQTLFNDELIRKYSNALYNRQYTDVINDIITLGEGNEHGEKMFMLFGIDPDFEHFPRNADSRTALLWYMGKKYKESGYTNENYNVFAMNFGHRMLENKFKYLKEDVAGGRVTFEDGDRSYQWIAPDPIGLMRAATALTYSSDAIKSESGIEALKKAGELLTEGKLSESDKVSHLGFHSDNKSYKNPYTGLANGEIYSANMKDHRERRDGKAIGDWLVGIGRWPSGERNAVQLRKNVLNSYYNEMAERFGFDKDITYHSVSDNIAVFLDNDFDGDTVTVFQGGLVDVIKAIEDNLGNVPGTDVNQRRTPVQFPHEIGAKHKITGRNKEEWVKLFTDTIMANVKDPYSLGLYDNYIDLIAAIPNSILERMDEYKYFKEKFKGTDSALLLENYRVLLQERLYVAYILEIDRAKTGIFPERFRTQIENTKKAIENTLIEITGVSVDEKGKTAKKFTPEAYGYASSGSKREQHADALKHEEKTGERFIIGRSFKMARNEKGKLYKKQLKGKNLPQDLLSGLARAAEKDKSELFSKDDENNAADSSFTFLMTTSDENYSWAGQIDQPNSVVYKVVAWWNSLYNPKGPYKDLDFPQKMANILKFQNKLGLDNEAFTNFMLHCLSQNKKLTSWAAFFNFDQNEVVKKNSKLFSGKERHEGELGTSEIIINRVKALLAHDAAMNDKDFADAAERMFISQQLLNADYIFNDEYNADDEYVGSSFAAEDDGFGNLSESQKTEFVNSILDDYNSPPSEPVGEQPAKNPLIKPDKKKPKSKKGVANAEAGKSPVQNPLTKVAKSDKEPSRVQSEQGAAGRGNLGAKEGRPNAPHPSERKSAVSIAKKKKRDSSLTVESSDNYEVVSPESSEFAPLVKKKFGKDAGYVIRDKLNGVEIIFDSKAKIVPFSKLRSPAQKLFRAVFSLVNSGSTNLLDSAIFIDDSYEGSKFYICKDQRISEEEFHGITRFSKGMDKRNFLRNYRSMVFLPYCPDEREASFYNFNGYGNVRVLKHELIHILQRSDYSIVSNATFSEEKYQEIISAIENDEEKFNSIIDGFRENDKLAHLLWEFTERDHGYMLGDAISLILDSIKSDTDITKSFSQEQCERLFNEILSDFRDYCSAVGYKDDEINEEFPAFVFSAQLSAGKIVSFIKEGSPNYSEKVEFLNSIARSKLVIGDYIRFVTKNSGIKEHEINRIINFYVNDFISPEIKNGFDAVHSPDEFSFLKESKKDYDFSDLPFADSKPDSPGYEEYTSKKLKNWERAKEIFGKNRSTSGINFHKRASFAISSLDNLISEKNKDNPDSRYDDLAKIVIDKKGHTVVGFLNSLVHNLKEIHDGNFAPEILDAVISDYEALKDTQFFSDSETLDHVDVLRSLQDLVDAIKVSISEEKKAINTDAGRKLHDAAAKLDSFVRNVIQSNEDMLKAQEESRSPLVKKISGKLLSALFKYQLNPTTALRMLSGFVRENAGEKTFLYSLAEEIEKGAKDKMDIFSKAHHSFDALKKVDGFMDLITGKTNVIDTGITELTGDITEVELMTLYRQMKSLRWSGELEQVRGIHVGENSEFVKLKRDQVNDLYSSIEKYISDNRLLSLYDSCISSAFSTVYSGAKDVSKSVYGYSPVMFRPDSYAPIKWWSQKNTDTDFDFNDVTNNPGYMMHRSDSKTGILDVRPMSKVVDDYVMTMSDFIGFRKIRLKFALYTNRPKGHSNPMFRQSPSLISIASDALGEKMGEFFQSYAKDLNGVKRQRHKSFEKITHNMQGGILVGNPSVMIKQSASYWNAMGILSPTSLLKAIPKGLKNPKGGRGNSALDYREITGEIDPTLTSLVNKDKDNSLFGVLAKKSKVISGLLNGISAIDYLTVNALYYATCYEVRDVMKIDPKNESKFIENVENKFNDVVIQSQPMFMPELRAEYARSTDIGIRVMTMFRTQQTQNFNLIVRTIGEYKATKSAESKKILKQTLGGQVASAIALGTMQVAADFFLHRLDKYRDKDDEDEDGDEKELNLKRILQRITINSVAGGASTVLMADELVKLFIDYALDVPGNESFGLSFGVISNYQQFIKSALGALKTGDLNKFRRAVGQFAIFSGMPVNNAYNWLNTMILYSLDAMGANKEDYDDFLILVENEYRSGSKKEASQNANVLLNAIQNSNDAKAQRVFEKMGNDEKALNAIKKEAKERYAAGKISAGKYENTLRGFVYGSGFDSEGFAEDIADIDFERLTGVAGADVKDAYISGKFSRSDTINYLVTVKNKGVMEAAETVKTYDFERKYPDIENPSESFVMRYERIAEPSGISPYIAHDAWKKSKGARNIDYNFDGETDYSAQDQFIDYLASLDITDEQRRVIWVFCERSLKKCPW